MSMTVQDIVGPDVLARVEGVVVRAVVVVDYLSVDGERALRLVHTDNCSGWELEGLLLHAQRSCELGGWADAEG